MKYFLLLTAFLLSACATKSELKNLENRVQNLSIKEACARQTLEILLLMPVAADPRNFENEGDFMQAQFVLVDLKTKQEESCKKYKEIQLNEQKN